MRYLSISILLVVLIPLSSRGSVVDATTMEELAGRYQYVLLVDGNDPASMRFVYADQQQHVHVYRISKGKLVLEWETTNLASRVVAVMVQDLYDDGEREMVIATEGGRILIYDMASYDLLWENLQDPFEKIDCMVAHNIDGDAEDELIFVADSRLFIYDSENHTLEWQSQKKFEAQQILVANVDEDEQPEIILNTGAIIDSRFYNVEFESNSSFGERIALLDINGDKIPEIFGEFSNFSIRVFDVYAERELW